MLEFNTINGRDTTNFDSEDDFHTGCLNVRHCQQFAPCEVIRALESGKFLLRESVIPDF